MAGSGGGSGSLRHVISSRLARGGGRPPAPSSKIHATVVVDPDRACGEPEVERGAGPRTVATSTTVSLRKPRPQARESVGWTCPAESRVQSPAVVLCVTVCETCHVHAAGFGQG